MKLENILNDKYEFNNLTLRQLGAYDMICSCYYKSICDNNFSFIEDGLNLVESKYINKKDYKKLPLYFFRMQDPFWGENISKDKYFDMINKVENNILPIVWDYANDHNIDEDKAVIEIIKSDPKLFNF